MGSSLPITLAPGSRGQAEQALLLLQEQVYAAWRGRRILSLVSFDVKGAYNGVCKERLLQRMKARGIPEGLLRWVEAFLFRSHGFLSKSMANCPRLGFYPRPACHRGPRYLRSYFSSSTQTWYKGGSIATEEQ